MAILTVTLNPALDVSGTVDGLVPDEKSYVRDEIHHPGGNGINAGIIASRLNVRTTVTGFLGGTTGQEIKALLKKENLFVRFVEIPGKTRMNVTISNKKDHRQTRLSFPGPVIPKNSFEKLSDLILKQKKNDLVLFGGSFPGGVKEEFVAALIKELKNKEIMTFVDVPGKNLRKIIPAGPYFIKPNLIEFQDLINTRKETLSDLLPLIKKLHKKIPLICVSSVEGGAILSNSSEWCFGKIPEIKIRSTVGAGDSMVGAIMAALHQNRESSLKDLLSAGLAAAAATLSEAGMTLGKKESIERLRKKIKITKCGTHS